MYLIGRVTQSRLICSKGWMEVVRKLPEGKGNAYGVRHGICYRGRFCLVLVRRLLASSVEAIMCRWYGDTCYRREVVSLICCCALR